MADDRDRRGGRGLAVKRRLGSLREHTELGQLRCQQFFVRGDDGFAGGERGDEDRLDRGAARGFDDDVDFRIADQFERAIGIGMPVARGPRSLVTSRTAMRDTRNLTP